jgi:hypothetical protein
MRAQHGGRQGAGRPRKRPLEDLNHTTGATRIQQLAEILQQQQSRAIQRGKLETAGRIEARRLELLAKGEQ